MRTREAKEGRDRERILTESPRTGRAPHTELESLLLRYPTETTGVSEVLLIYVFVFCNTREN